MSCGKPAPAHCLLFPGRHSRLPCTAFGAQGAGSLLRRPSGARQAALRGSGRPLGDRSALWRSLHALPDAAAERQVRGCGQHRELRPVPVSDAGLCGRPLHGQGALRPAALLGHQVHGRRAACAPFQACSTPRERLRAGLRAPALPLTPVRAGAGPPSAAAAERREEAATEAPAARRGASPDVAEFTWRRGGSGRVYDHAVGTVLYDAACAPRPLQRHHAASTARVWLAIC